MSQQENTRWPSDMVPTFSIFSPNAIINPVVPSGRQWSMKSIFSDNAQVYYKPGSLSYGGVGTTRNSRAKWKKT